MICIIGAIKEEISGIKQRTAIKKKFTAGSATFYQGFYKKKEIIIARSGVGPAPAQSAVSDVLKMFPLKSIISIGFAGGLISELKVSDIILAEKIFYCENEKSFFKFNKVPLLQAKVSCNQGERIKKILTDDGIRFKTGNLISVSRVAESAEFKEWVGRNYPVCGVEMETASIAKIVAQTKVPFFSLRVISDEVSQSIIQSDQFTDKKGKINRFVAGYYILTHPSLIPRAVELKKNLSKASKTLTHAVLKVIDGDIHS